MTTPARMRVLLDRLGYATQADLASALGVQPSAISQWANSRNGVSRRHLLAMARVAGTTPERIEGFLLRGEGFRTAKATVVAPATEPAAAWFWRHGLTDAGREAVRARYSRDGRGR